MKISLIGTGKTGKRLIDVVPQDYLIGTFNSKNPPDMKKIEESDVCIIFVPGDAMESLIPKLIKSSTPMVIGSTGFQWREKDKERLLKEKKRWVHGHNFSITMNIVYSLLKEIGRSKKLLEKVSFEIHEIHHADKKDAPSGTALKWKEWLGISEVKFSHERKGDTIGIHELIIKTPMEEMKLSHSALDRNIFIRGAIWAAQKLQDSQDLPYGLIPFESLVSFYVENGESS